MQALKALVIFMGVLIAVGVTVVGVTIYRRATDMAGADKSMPSEPSPSGIAVQGGAGGALTLSNAAPQSFGSRDLGLPPGSEIVSVQPLTLQQGQQQIVLHVRLPDGGARILVLDPRHGNIAGEWRVPGAPNSGGTPRP